jgi:hypothetical protein
MKYIKLFLFTVIFIMIYSTTTEAAIKFHDVPNTSSAAKSINKLVELDLVKGYADGSFLPKKSINRAEFAKIFSSFTNGGFKIQKNNTQYFNDIPLSHWASDDVAFLFSRKILVGTSSDKFSPNQALTRGELAYSFMKYFQYSVPQSFTINFKDVPKNHPYYNAIRALVYHKITTGTSSTTFSPNSPLTREQIAIFLDRTGKLDQGLRYKQKDDLSAFYTSGSTMLPFEKFETLKTTLGTRIFTLKPEFNPGSGPAPTYTINKTMTDFEFDQNTIVDGDFYYSLMYHGWGIHNQFQHFVKFTFKDQQVISFKIYSDEEYELFKQNELSTK